LRTWWGRTGVLLLKEEVSLASRLSLLPADKQQEFFNSRVVPLQQVENAVVEDEIEMAIDAIKRGVPLPKDILEALESQRPPAANDKSESPSRH
jgi:hypothetical protein